MDGGANTDIPSDLHMGSVVFSLHHHGFSISLRLAYRTVSKPRKKYIVHGLLHELYINLMC